MLASKPISIFIVSAFLLTGNVAKADSATVQAGDVRVTVDSAGNATVRSGSTFIRRPTEISPKQRLTPKYPPRRYPSTQRVNRNYQRCSQESYSYSSQSNGSSSSTTRTSSSTSSCR